MAVLMMMNKYFQSNIIIPKVKSLKNLIDLNSLGAIMLITLYTLVEVASLG
jgi:hypothetical protein